MVLSECGEGSGALSCEGGVRRGKGERGALNGSASCGEANDKGRGGGGPMLARGGMRQRRCGTGEMKGRSNADMQARGYRTGQR
jgi:hypothetical protein